MGRLTALILSVLLLAGCSGEMGETQGAAEALGYAAAPAEALHLEYASDAPSIGYYGQRDSCFYYGLQSAARELGVDLLLYESLEEADCGILILDHPETLPKDSVCFIYTEDPKQLILAEGGIRYAAEEEAAHSLKALCEYDGHEAPIRLIGLFTDANSPGARLYRSMEAEGKLYSKGAYYGPAKDAGVWTENQLEGITVGVLDSIYAETPELALAAYQALLRAERNDAVEVIGAGLSTPMIRAMMDQHFLMGAAVGPNEYGAGRLLLRMALCYGAGEPVEKLVLYPLNLQSDAIYALYKQGMVSIFDMLVELDPEAEQSYTINEVNNNA